MTSREIGLPRPAKSRITSSTSSIPPSTGTLRIACPRSAAEGDSIPTGQSCLTAPLSIPRSSTSASAARPINRVDDRVLQRGHGGGHVNSGNIDSRNAGRSARTPAETSTERWLSRPNKTGAVPLEALENENIIEDHERHRQHGRHAQDVQRVRQRNEAPFRRRQVEQVTNDDAECDEEGKDPQQQRQAGEEGSPPSKRK